jgi:putative transcriptional regulator
MEKGNMASSAPGILVAMPSLEDPYFSKTVILLCTYNHEGAFGLVMNQPSSLQVREVLTEDFQEHPAFQVPLLVGGPVQPESFWAIHTSDFKGESTSQISEELKLSSAPEVLRALIEERGPSCYHLGCGYSGWGPEQLDREIQEESWWLGPLDIPTILDIDYAARWENTLESLGFDPLMASLPSSGYA